MAMSKSIVSLTLSGVRVGAAPIYYPANITANGTVNQKLEFVVYANRKMRNGAEKVDRFDCVVWGKLADTCAHALHQGKEVTIVGEPHSYKKTMFNQDRSKRTDAAGVELQHQAINVTVEKLSFGDDGAKQIAAEIQAGERPAFWNVPWAADYELFRTQLKGRTFPTWDGRSNKLGQAEVRIPAGMKVDFSQYQGGTNPAPVQGQMYNGGPALPERPNAAGGVGGAGALDPAIVAAIAAAMKVAMTPATTTGPTPPAQSGQVQY